MDVLGLLQVVGAVLGALVAIVVGYWIYFRNNHYWVGKSIPYDTPIPFIGTAIGLVTRKLFHVVDQDLYNKYGRVFGTYNGPSPVIYVAEPELVKQILVKEFSNFSTRRVLISGNPINDNMLFVLPGGDQWKNVRNTMTPAFSSGKLKKFLPLVTECAESAVANFKKYSEGGKPVDCKRIFGSYTLDVIANVGFGTKLDSQNDPDNQFVYHAKRVFSVDINYKTLIALLLPRFGRLLGFSIFPADTMQFFEELTLSIVENRKRNKREYHDLLQILIESMEANEEAEAREKAAAIEKGTTVPTQVDDIKRKPLNRTEFLAQTIMFFIAGYDSTAATLTAATYYLATNPECQKKVLEEVDRIWKDRKMLDQDALNDAKYLGACIDETLRLSPPATRVERTCTKETKLGDTGVKIPKGLIVEIPIFAMHHDPKNFPDPEKFDPERFLDDSKLENTNSYAYLPFGNGPRLCIAQRLALLEVKFALLHVLRDFKFSPSAQTHIPTVYQNAVVLQMEDVILNVIKRR